MRKNAARTCLEVETLEVREVPAITNAAVAGGVLTVTGSNNTDRIEILRDLGTNQLVVKDFGNEFARFNSAGVTNIVVNALAGNDLVIVGTDVQQNATLNGGGGVQRFRNGGDVLTYRGLGVATLNGQGGDDYLTGSFNNDILNGGAGNDVLAGNGGNNVYTGDPAAGPFGRDTFFGVPANDVVTDLNAGGVLDADFRLAALPSVLADPFLGLPPTQETILLDNEVGLLLDRATAATASQDGVMVIVDRGGRILGARLENDVINYLNTLPAGTQPGQREFMRVFFIDGALAKARIAAFFGNNQVPLTSRTFQTTSETTLTQREIESYPSITDENSIWRGPGFVGPLGLNNHFPRGVAFTPQVDQFAIEHTNRDSRFQVFVDNIKGRNNGNAPGDDVFVQERFNVNPAFIPDRIKNGAQSGDPLGRAVNLVPPDSYGFASGILPFAQARGLGTLPGGIPIFKRNTAGQLTVVGGIGVFYPGKTGFATEENSSLSTNYDPLKVDRSMEAEFAAFAALGGSSSGGVAVGTLGGVSIPTITDPGNPNNVVRLFDLPSGRVDLVGLTLDVFGPKGLNGPKILADYGAALGTGVVNGQNQPLINPGLNNQIDTNTPALVNDDTGLDPNNLLNGTIIPEGWLVMPHDSNDGLISAQDVMRMTFQSVQQALITRGAIRLPLDSFAKFMITVTSKSGEVLGQFRMPDATVFSIDVSTAKARNASYYADPTALKDIDQVPGVPKGAAFTARTFRYLALPRFPEGIDGAPPGPFSQLNDDAGIDRTTSFFRKPIQPQDLFYDVRGTGQQIGPRKPAAAFQSVLGFNAFHPGTNFRDDRNTGQTGQANVASFQNPILNRDGIVFFPGSSPIYKGGVLVGGFGISGDGVDQDDIVTTAGVKGFNVPLNLRSDQFFFQGVRLPFAKFNRQPNINPYGSSSLGSPLERR